LSASALQPRLQVVAVFAALVQLLLERGLGLDGLALQLRRGLLPLGADLASLVGDLGAKRLPLVLKLDQLEGAETIELAAQLSDLSGQLPCPLTSTEDRHPLLRSCVPWSEGARWLRRHEAGAGRNASTPLSYAGAGFEPATFGL